MENYHACSQSHKIGRDNAVAYKNVIDCRAAKMKTTINTKCRMKTQSTVG